MGLTDATALVRFSTLMFYFSRGSSTVVGHFAIDQTEQTISLLHREFESDLSTVEMSVASSASLEYRGGGLGF